MSYYWELNLRIGDRLVDREEVGLWWTVAGIGVNRFALIYLSPLHKETGMLGTIALMGMNDRSDGFKVIRKEEIGE